MALEARLSVGDKEVAIHELTTAQIRDWMVAVENARTEGTVTLDLGDVLFEDVGFRELALMTDAKEEDFEELTPSELRELADECKKVNGHFFAMNERLNAGLKALVQQLPKNLSER